MQTMIKGNGEFLIASHPLQHTKRGIYERIPFIEKKYR